MGDRAKWLVSTDWLEAHLDSPDVVIVNGSWHMPTEGRNALAEHEEEHIPGAVYFDMDAIADQSTNLPHMVPTAEFFSQSVEKLGISDGQTIVVYDSKGIWSAPRVWWTFRVMGVKEVFVLEGGLPKWKREGRALSDQPTHRTKGHFQARLDHGAVSNHADMLLAMDDPDIHVVDARAADRWRGLAPEPRPNLPSGAMPNSKNVPFTQLIDEEGCLKPVDVLNTIFEEAGVDLTKKIITSCGSGSTAAVLTLALDTIGARNLSLYDGSWTEWAGRDDSVIMSEA